MPASYDENVEKKLLASYELTENHAETEVGIGYAKP